MSRYTLSAEVKSPFDDTLVATRAALADQGFGVLTEIDMAATLKAKLDVVVPRQVILGVCRPSLAHVALQADPSAATMLPCTVVIRSVDDSGCIVEAFDPAVMAQLAPKLEQVAAEAARRLTAALASIAEED